VLRFYRIAKRLAVPVLLLLGGTASLVYGLAFHRVTVYEQKQRQISIAIPAPFGFPPPSSPDAGGPGEGQPMNPGDKGADDGQAPGPPGQQAGSGAAGEQADPFGGPSPAGPPREAENPFEAGPGAPLPPSLSFQKQTVTEDYLEAQDDPERSIVLDVTFGGVVREADGRLKRTYSGQPPSLCPS
jgi:hypothetical protein